MHLIWKDVQQNCCICASLDVTIGMEGEHDQMACSGRIAEKQIGQSGYGGVLKLRMSVEVKSSPWGRCALPLLLLPRFASCFPDIEVEASESFWSGWVSPEPKFCRRRFPSFWTAGGADWLEATSAPSTGLVLGLGRLGLRNFGFGRVFAVVAVSSATVDDVPGSFLGLCRLRGLVTALSLEGWTGLFCRGGRRFLCSELASGGAEVVVVWVFWVFCATSMSLRVKKQGKDKFQE